MSVAGVEVHSVTVSPSQLTVAIGDTLRLQATVRDEAGNTLSDRPVTWSSDDPDIATVEGGLVRGIGPGTAPIRASSGGAAGESAVTVMQRSSIVLSEGVLDFQAMTGTGPSDTRAVGISNGGEAPLSGLQTAVSYASDDTGWLEATLAGTTAPTEVSIRADPSDLPPGSYRADVEVIASAADNSPQLIEVTLEVDDAPPAVQVEPEAVGFAVAEGEGVPAPQVVSVTNSGGGEVTDLDASISYAEGGPTGWLEAELAGTEAPTQLTLRVDPSGLESPAVLDAVVDVTSPVAESSGRVQVRFQLGEPPPEIALDPTEIGWAIVENTDSPPTREVTVENGGARTLGGLSASVVYGAGASEGWLEVVVEPSAAPAVLTASLATTALLPGDYEATIQVRSDDAINSPQAVDVSLRVAPRASPETSLITTSHVERVADGASGAVITVQLRDSRGDDMPSGGDEVQLSTNLGALTSVSDQGEGRYRATLTSTESGTATITGTVNGDVIDDGAAVQFVAGPVAAVQVVGGDGQNGVVGTPLDDPLEVRVVDADDNPVGGATVNWETDDGSPGPSTSQTDAQGLASTIWTLGTTAGAQYLVASVPAGPSATFDATGEPGPPAVVVIIAGNDQVGVVGEELDEELVVEVRDEHGNAVGAGEPVSWQPDDEGAADPESSNTGENGRATTSWTLGPAPGEQSLEAIVEGVGSVTFDATAEALPPDNVVIESGSDQTGTVGQELDDPLQVLVRDSENAPLSGVTVTWTPASGDGSANPTTSETDANGIASTSWTLGSTPGAQSLEASVEGVAPATFSATAEALPPDNVDVASGDGQAGSVGEPLAAPLEVQVTDALGDPVSGVTVTWTPASGNGSADPTTSETDASGIASTTWTLGSTPGAQSLDASVEGVAPVTFGATAEAVPPDNVDIASGDGQAGTVGEPLAAPIEVLVTDSGDNPVSGVTVTWTPASGGGSADPTASQTDANGIASTSWTLGSTPGAQSLEASVPGAGPVTFNATAEALPPENVVIEDGNNQTGTVGQPLAAPIEVLVTDSGDSPVSDVTVSWAPSADGSVNPNTSQTDANGIASATWTLGSTPGAQSLDAGVAGVSPVTFDATAEVGSPDAITITGGNGQEGIVNETLEIPLEVQVNDALGNPVVGVMVTFSAIDGAADPTTAPTDANGVASTSWTLGSNGGAQELEASAEGVDDPVTFQATANADPGAT